jgi:hypothetical protein
MHRERARRGDIAATMVPLQCRTGFHCEFTVYCHDPFVAQFR